MPWDETNAMTERMKMVLAYEAGESKRELGRRFGVAPRIVGKWVERFEQEGPAGLVDRSRAAHTHPNQTPRQVVGRILTLREAHPLWGAPKLRAVLAREHLIMCWELPRHILRV